MFPPQFLRLLLPAQNPLGFSVVDFMLLGLAALLVVGILAMSWLVQLACKLSRRTGLCLVLLFCLPVVLRLASLGHHPVPTPAVADDFSYLLLGDTLAHLRFANPVHPMHRFFEGVFILQEPSYASIYPMGQGLVLAFGQLVFHQPWAGVVISIGLLAALTCWMLLGWVSSPWALLGGLLAAIQFGPLSPWMNTYWGGAISAIAGCLIFGAIPRLPACSIVLGLGLGLELLTRPFEFVLLLPIVLLFRPPRRSIAIAALVLLPFAGLVLLQNKQVTGNWTTLPYQLSRYRYGIPTTFTLQTNPVPHGQLTVEQKVDYDAQVLVHGPVDTLSTYLRRLTTRIRFYPFFLLAPLYVVLPAFVPALREARFRRVAIALTAFWLGDAFYPYFYPHYMAVVTCLFVLVSVESLKQLSRLRVGPQIVTLLLALCVGDFVLDFSNGFTSNEDPEGRARIYRTVQNAPGKQLVFVRYSPQHGAHEWIHNSADIDASRVVWAIDLGADEDTALKRYYPDRQAWLLEPDSHPPSLTSY